MTSQIQDYLSIQPVINIGMLGSVSDGKSTTVYQLTGTKTQKHSSEQIRNITIKPGYANMKIYQNDNKLLSGNSSDHVDGELIHHLSFIDCPGHYELILTMLSSVDLMQGAIVIVSAAEPIERKPQLLQHLLALKIANFSNIIICFNKLDLIPKDLALKRKRELDNLLAKLEITPKVIIPVCMNKKLGVDFLLDNIIKYMPPKIMRNDEVPQFRVTRSFDINKKYIPINNFKGGVLGGSLVKGKLKVGDTIEIRPGLINKLPNGKFKCMPLKTKILSLQTDTEKLDNIIPGGLIGIGTNIDPFYCKNDNLSGSVIGLENQLPSIYDIININFTLLLFDKESEWKPKVNNDINIQIATLSINSKIIECKNNKLKIQLSKPACIDESMMIIVSTKVNKTISIVGYGYLFGKNDPLLE